MATDSNSPWEDNVPALTRDATLMVDPSQYQRLILLRIQEAYAGLYRERELSGGVTKPEDAFAMLRRLGVERDRFAALKGAMGAGEKLLRTLMEEELAEAVGEQEGVPNSGLTVPDAEGDIRLTLDTKNEYAIDLDELVAMLVLDALDHMEQLTGVPTPDHIAGHLQSLVIFVFQVMESWGKFEPQVSKVKAYADSLARAGHDDRAARVSAAIVKRTTYKGVGFERKTS